MSDNIHASKTYVDKIAALKVDKVDGKGLSTNDYTTAEKDKLADIEEGAEKNLAPVTPDASATKGQVADAKATYDALREANDAANAAQSKAESAYNKAVGAQSIAEAAQTTATEAKDSAGAAQARADDAYDAAMLSVYYPEGNVTSVSQITTEGLEYAYDETNHTATLTDGKSATGDVVIPWRVAKDGAWYTVTAVGEVAFMYATITSVIAPTSVTSIDAYTFNICPDLTSVSFPSATSVGSNAFAGCSALTSASFPSVTSVGSNAFAGCSALTSVDFGATPRDSVPTLESYAFDGVPTTCKFIIPLGMYDEWISAPGWSNLYAEGYKFVGYADAADVAVVQSTANAAIPKYGSVDAAVADGTVTLTPYSRNALTSDGTAFVVAMGGSNTHLRDCVFVVTAGDTAPNISWGEVDGQTFHPRTDAATDMEIAAGVTKVFWVSEYAEGQFAVAGWQVTEGGNAEEAAQ